MNEELNIVQAVEVLDGSEDQLAAFNDMNFLSWEINDIYEEADGIAKGSQWELSVLRGWRNFLQMDRGDSSRAGSYFDSQLNILRGIKTGFGMLGVQKENIISAKNVAIANVREDNNLILILNRDIANLNQPPN